jgi:hypothetical protein
VMRLDVFSLDEDEDALLVSGEGGAHTY